MAEVNYDKLVKLVKKNNGISQRAAAEQLGVTQGQLSMLIFSQAKVEAGLYSKIPATAASVKKARSEGDRWEMIAARTGQSVAAVKELAGGGTGRATKPAASKPAAPKSGRQTGKSNKPAGRTTGGRQTAGRTTGGRRSSAANPS